MYSSGSLSTATQEERLLLGDANYPLRDAQAFVILTRYLVVAARGGWPRT